MDFELSPHEFELFRRLIYDKTGITLNDNKVSLVRGRLQKRVKTLGLSSFQDYYHYLLDSHNEQEFGEFVTAVSTNVTSFFRESKQWEYLNKILPDIIATKNKKLRIWSAGCSSGEEPYSLITFFQNKLPDFEKWDIKILATDISHKALRKAIDGEYDKKSIETSYQHNWISKSFEHSHTTPSSFRIKNSLKEKIVFRLFNLVNDPFIINKQFDFIFCRNVMIYFDDPTRLKLYHKFASVLKPDGIFFIGSSEAILDKNAPFELLGSSIYRLTKRK